MLLQTSPVANGVDAPWLKTNPSQTEGEKNGEGRTKTEGRRKAGGGRGNTMAVLYSIVLKGYSSQRPAVRFHTCISMGGIKSMPNSFMGMGVEKWPIMKSHRQTAGDQTHLM